MRFPVLRPSYFGVLSLAAALSVGCHAQAPTPAPAPSKAQQELNRRVEVLVRSHYDIPSDVNVQIGARTKSEFTGYDTISVIFVRDGASSTPVTFLLSTDNKNLVRFEKFDISQDPRNSIPTAGRPARGPADAPVVIVSFDDLQCPYCSQMHTHLMTDAMARYKGQLRIVYKDFPLESIHPWAMHASVNANCLAAQSHSGYWNLVDYLHAHGSEIAGPEKDVKKAFANLDRLTTDEGARQKVNLEVLNACIAKQDETAMKASIQLGQAEKIDATPTLFINGERVNGAIPEDELWKVIDRALVGEGITPPPLPPPAAAPSPAL